MPPDGSRHGQLQDGIYFRREPTPRAYRLVLLQVIDGVSARQAHEALSSLWAMLRRLQQGVVADLEPRAGEAPPERYPGKLSCLLGFGASLFAPERKLTPGGSRPERLAALVADSFGPFPRLKWAPGEGQPDRADLAVQLIGDSELVVNRAVVEIYRLIGQRARRLRLVTFYGGFNREDKRSWLNFHDGVSNLRWEERAEAMEVAAADPPAHPAWMVGGTYMAALRLAVKIEDWWKVPRNLQEIIVGRDKLSGCPLESVTAHGLVPVAMRGCPVLANHPKVPEHYEARAAPASQLVAMSHMRRANPTREGPAHPGSNRIFRQGYEFLEPLAGGGLRTGLNFVSFQRDLASFENILTTPAWMRTVNFGGPDDRVDVPNVTLAQVLAGSYYAVPPKDDRAPFPGAGIFLARG